MSVQDISLNPKILESAKKEFLEKGFLNASVKEICSKAGVTTGALYKRYKGKAELFDDVVKSVIKEIKEYGKIRLKACENMIDRNNLFDMWINPEESYIMQINYFYDNYEIMRLLLVSSEGTKHHNFSHTYVDDLTNVVYEFSKKVYKKNLSLKLIDKELIHTLLTAYMASIFESIIHEYSREQAISYSKVLAVFFNWKEVLGY